MKFFVSSDNFWLPSIEHEKRAFERVKLKNAIGRVQMYM